MHIDCRGCGAHGPERATHNVNLAERVEPVRQSHGSTPSDALENPLMSRGVEGLSRIVRSPYPDRTSHYKEVSR
jgi:hypothetical protein